MDLKNCVFQGYVLLIQRDFSPILLGGNLEAGQTSNIYFAPTKS